MFLFGLKFVKNMFIWCIFVYLIFVNSRGIEIEIPT